MPAPNTGTLLYNPVNGKNRTGTALSTNIIIKIGPNIIGAIQSISINENRSIQMINEIGTDGNIDSAPQGPVTIGGSCSRVRFDRMRLAEALGRGYIHLQSQRFPFDIEIIDQWAGDGNNAIVTTLKNVWMDSLTTNYDKSNYIITDSMNWKAETIYSVFSGTANNVATGGERNIPLAINAIERAADRGDRRGALDSGGLIRQFIDF
jgi:hypothetical protein